MHVVITSGGTRVPIDPVRSITNSSTGAFGMELAIACLVTGHNVSFVHAKGSLTPFKPQVDICKYRDSMKRAQMAEMYWARHSEQYTETEFDTFENYDLMLHKELLKKPDVVFLAAAVSDYGVVASQEKIRSVGDMSLSLTRLPKLIKGVRQCVPQSILVGFKLLVEEDREKLHLEAKKSIEDNDCDYVVANSLNEIRSGRRTIMVVKKSDPENPTVFHEDHAAHLIDLMGLVPQGMDV